MSHDHGNENNINECFWFKQMSSATIPGNNHWITFWLRLYVWMYIHIHVYGEEAGLPIVYTNTNNVLVQARHLGSLRFILLTKAFHW